MASLELIRRDVFHLFWFVSILKCSTSFESSKTFFQQKMNIFQQIYHAFVVQLLLCNLCTYNVVYLKDRFYAGDDVFPSQLWVYFPPGTNTVPTMLLATHITVNFNKNWWWIEKGLRLHHWHDLRLVQMYCVKRTSLGCFFYACKKRSQLENSLYCINACDLRRSERAFKAHSHSPQRSADSAVDCVNAEIGIFLSLRSNATICRRCTRKMQ